MNLRSCSRISAAVLGRFAYFFAILLAVLGCIAQLSAQNIINTIAGGGTLPPFSTAATGNYADIPGPTSVVTDRSGNVYVVAPTANQIYKIDPTGATMSVFAGMGWPSENPKLQDGKPATQGFFNTPSGLAIDNAGNIYVADTQAYLVRRIDTNGVMTTVAGWGDLCQTPGHCGNNVPATSSLALLAVPTGVATDAAGNVYIADTGDNQIRVVNMQTSSITVYGVTVGAGNIATVVGTGTPCSSPTSPCGDNGKATSAMLNRPQSVSIDHLGNMFIADTGDHRIRGVVPSGFIGAYAGNGTTCNGGPCGDTHGALIAQLSSPSQIYIDAGDNLYIADSPTNRVRKVTPGKNPPTTAIITTFAGNGAVCTNAHVTTTFCGDTGSPTTAWLNSPSGVYLDASSNVYIADTGDQRVRKVTSGATPTINTFAGGGLGDGPAAASILAGSRDVAVDNAGNVYVADTGNNTIRKISGGTVTTVAGAGMAGYFGNGILAVNANLNQPWGLALDNSGNIYVADTTNLVIRVVNTQSSPIRVAGVNIQPGAIATVAGTPGQACTAAPPGCGDNGPATSASFGFPAEVALDNNGNFFVADSTAHRIREVNVASGTISTFAGNGTPCPTPTNFAACGDGGLATSAMLSQPHSVVVDSADNVYIADSGDNRIRVVNPSGTINAFAFNGLFNSFGPDGVAALSSGYTLPLYVAVDSRGNVFVSGSSIYYLVQRIDTSINPLVNPVASVAGRGAGDAKYYGFFGDGTSANGAYINNYAARVDSTENLYIADGGNNRVREVSSSPTQGMVPSAFVSPTSLNFPPTVVGQQSQLSFKLANTGDDDLLVSLPSITGPFTFANQSPCPGNIVTPDTSCSYTVTFTPTSDGTAKGTATVNDNGFNNPSQHVALTGTGPDFTIAANPNSLTIARGGQQQSTITLTPLAGYNSSITLSCTGLPSGTTCGFGTNPVTMNGTTAQNSTLTVSVGSSTAPGSYTIGVKGASITTHSTPISLTVQ
jgi:sugar lactone lactonase YvrE